MLTEVQQSTLADLLHAAERDRAPIPPLTESHPELGAADAYEIQLRNIRRRTAEVVGHKVGLSSKAMQQMMGVDEPDYGHLLADMRLSESVPVDAGRYCYPGWRSRSPSSSAPTCPARAAPRRTCSPPRRRTRRPSS
ncbi:2-keto-4-pentenoate hydratase [Phytohabitans rumicis]|uniref:2-keto-4-pentenoate hydratase n=1 Tax=Phytohabitans rumicis TaxID=1076125 RepID=A0A6V8LNJ2_9ACTN|nr:hypothetical protein [Phytohabitans rumicis]GFJ96428.1 hypothetical protein Prum_100700 [Phytohabitans rumicis]